MMKIHKEKKAPLKDNFVQKRPEPFFGRDSKVEKPEEGQLEGPFFRLPGTQRITKSERAGPGIQKQIALKRLDPKDVAVEMIGRKFQLIKDINVGKTVIKTGEKVVITAWDNDKDSVTVSHSSVTTSFDVPKRLLEPTRTQAGDIAPYSAGVAGQARAVEKNEKQLEDHLAKEAEYKRAKNEAGFEEEKKRLEELLKKRQAVLNEKLIQETMFNRFDAIIKKEVDTANSAAGLTGKAALDSNIVKSMLFQESQLGTSGQHLEVPPSHPVKTRFNLGQVIDSSGMALFTLMEKEKTALVAKHNLSNFRKDLSDAQKELKDIKAKAGSGSLTSAEQSRLQLLKRLSAQYWEAFIWAYKTDLTTGVSDKSFSKAVSELFASTSPSQNFNYEFWIHMVVMWLFTKKRSGMTWEAAVKAYNGGGSRAEKYKKEVIARASTAKKKHGRKEVFQPSGI